MGFTEEITSYLARISPVYPEGPEIARPPPNVPKAAYIGSREGGGT